LTCGKSCGFGEGLTQDGSLLAVEFFFGEGAFVTELLELAQLVDNAVLGIGAGVIGWIGAGVTAGVGGGPNQTKDPGNQGPAEEEVDGEDGAGAWMAAEGGDDGGEEIEYQASSAEGEAEGAGENVDERKVKHSGNKFSVFLL